MWLSVEWDVGAQTGSDPSADLIARGKALSPPLVLVAVLLLGALVAQLRGRVEGAGVALVGLGGLGLLLCEVVGIGTDLAVARSLGGPEGPTVLLGGLTAAFGLGFASLAASSLVRR
jgi:hypothetical protein